MIGILGTMVVGGLTVAYWPDSGGFVIGYALGIAAGWSVWRLIPIGR